MKLIKIHIENFGKLSEFDYEFKDGINTIIQENGYGKTTFAEFVKAMFYGMENRRNTKVLLDRKKYAPWQGGAYGGYLDFEIDNSPYRIERFFANKDVDDTFVLYDLTTNLKSNRYSSNIGEELFKINKEAFERSTFISGQNIETSMNDSINAKLGNILESENDINTSEKAINFLEESIKYYKKTGGRGKINETIIEKLELEQKLEKAKIDEKNLVERKNKIINIDLEIQNTMKEHETYKNMLESLLKEEAMKAKYEQYTIINNNVNEVKQNLSRIEKSYDENNELQDKIEYNRNKIDSLNAKSNQYNKKIDKIKKNTVIDILILLTSFILMIIGFYIKNVILKSSAIILFFIIIFVIGLNAICIIKNKKLRNNLNRELDNITKLNVTLISMLEKQLNEKNVEIDRLSKDFHAKLAIKEQYEKENNISEIMKYAVNINRINKQEVENKIFVINNKINKLNEDKHYIQSQIDILENSLDSIFELENDIQNLSTKIEEMKDKCIILEKTKKYLQIAKEQFSSHYMGPMKENFIKNVDFLNGDELKIDIDVNLKPQLYEKGTNKDMRFLSTGYKDLIYICMRISLIDCLFENENPFIILDDPFVNLDENKIQNAIKLISKISKKYQIIYFTCHESRKI